MVEGLNTSYGLIFRSYVCLYKRNITRLTMKENILWKETHLVSVVGYGKSPLILRPLRLLKANEPNPLLPCRNAFQCTE